MLAEIALCFKNDGEQPRHNEQKIKTKKMKKKLLALTVTFVFVMATMTVANAQALNDVGKSAQNGNMANNTQPGKVKDFLVTGDLVNAKALKDFRKSYKDVSPVKWLRNQYGYTAEFPANDVYNVLYYDTRGHWLALMKNYNEEKLDKKLRSLVKSEYFDYKILNVQEITTTYNSDVPTYLFYLEQGKDFKIVRVQDHEMDVYQQLTRQE